MLSELTIENIAVIEQTAIGFDNGFNCLTGETGAGKSIIIDAINCITGEKTSRELIRSGCDSARVTASFVAISEKVRQTLAELGIKCEEDNSLVISRIIGREGRNTCRINGEAATVTMLRTLGKTLINIHGQHDSQSLLSPEKHIDIIDALADNEKERADYAELYGELMRLSDRIELLCGNEAERLKRMDMLQFQIDELKKARLKIGETEQLKQRRTILQNSQKISANLEKILINLDGDEESEGAAGLIRQGTIYAQRAAELMPDAAKTAETLNELSYNCSEAIAAIRDYLSQLNYSQEELEELEDRLDLLLSLQKKYGSDEEKMLSYLAAAERELEASIGDDELLDRLNSEFEDLLIRTRHSARVLSETRRKASDSFVEKVCEELSFLDMPSVRLSVERKATALRPSGIDELEFYISANAGEDERPLAATASGGELSRIMLAIKSVMAAKDDIDTLIFDEIDTGVSGRAAGKIAVKMKQIAKTSQVLCVTHLAQIAAYADSHFLIEKMTRNGRTYTAVSPLTREGRIKELARISGGISISELQLRSAEELLNNSDL